MPPHGSSRSSSHLRVVDAPGGVDARDEARARDRRRLLAAARGDRAAAEDVYDTLEPGVRAALARTLGNGWADGDDLVQQVFVELMRSAEAFRAECSLATWAGRIATHLALNAIRSKRRHGAVFAREESPEAVEPAPRHDVADLVRAALARLAPEKAEAVVLHDLVGHDLAEIAALCDITVAAAQTRLSRGRAELRQILEREGARR